MGLFSFFRDRRARESAIAGTDGQLSSAVPGSDANPMSDGHALGDLGTLISQLQQFKEASAQIQPSGQVFDLRGTDARSEVMDVLRQHGLDPANGETAVDDPEAMQRDIMAALERAGLDLGAMGVPMPMGEPPKPLDPEELRRNPDLGIQNPLDR